MFSAFVKTRLLTKGNDLSFEKMYLLDSDNILSKDKSLPLGKSPVSPKVKNMSFVFWMNFNSSSSSVSNVPKMAARSIVLFAILVKNLNEKSTKFLYFTKRLSDFRAQVAHKINIVFYVTGYFLLRSLQEMPNIRLITYLKTMYLKII